MRQLLFSLQFKGCVAPVGTSPNAMKASMTASSCTWETAVSREGVRGRVEPAGSDQVRLESEVIFVGGFESAEVTSAGEGGFKETGTITFGEGGHRLRFSTIGQGYIGPSIEPNLRQGAVMWQVDGGEGQFEGARGLITSNFTVSDTGEVTDHQLGIIFIR
jgi:hypothetical protein